MQPRKTTRFPLLITAFLKGVLSGLGLLVVFAAGFFVRDLLPVGSLSTVLADPSERYPLLQEVEDLLNTHYLRELPEQTQLEYAAYSRADWFAQRSLHVVYRSPRGTE
jgi:hypothetical protein